MNDERCVIFPQFYLATFIQMKIFYSQSKILRELCKVKYIRRKRQILNKFT